MTLALLVQRGMAALPDLHVSDSSEAMLSGRKPPFRLLVRAAHRDGRKVNIRHAVSEGFVVSCFCCLCAVLVWQPLQLLLVTLFSRQAYCLCTKHASFLLCTINKCILHTASFASYLSCCYRPPACVKSQRHAPLQM